MIAPKENEHRIRIVTLGLNQKELALIDGLLKRVKGQLITASDDMDLWGLVRTGEFDLCVLGQGGEIEDPSYLIWLLRGLANHSRIILIYSNISSEEANRLDRFHASYVLQRPVDSAELIHTLESALNGRHERSQRGFWQRVASLVPMLRHS